MNALWLGIVLFLCSLTEGKKCDQLLRETADVNGKFVQCAGAHTAPVTLCIECNERYINSHKAYLDLLNEIDTDNTSCKSKYIDNDRLNIIETLNKHLDDLWSTAYCSECYAEDGSITNETEAIRDLYVKFRSCNSTQDKHINICEKCEVPYKNLNGAFQAMKEEKGNKICFDIQDFMNRTRSDWTKTCGHPKSTVSLLAFAAVSSVMSSIPILFYCGFVVYTRRRESNQPLLNEDLENTTSSRNVQSEGNNSVNPEPLPSTSRDSMLNTQGSNSDKLKEKEMPDENLLDLE